MKMTAAEIRSHQARHGFRDPLQPLACEIAAKTPPEAPQRQSSQAGGCVWTAWSFTIRGQVRGGKNNMIVTRNGHHIPKPAWKKWRDDAVAQVRAQLPAGWKPVGVAVKVRCDYVAGDRRRRDQPAILDAVFHVFEKAGVVRDDTLIWVAEGSRTYDKAAPSITVSLLP